MSEDIYKLLILHHFDERVVRVKQVGDITMQT